MNYAVIVYSLFAVLAIPRLLKLWQANLFFESSLFTWVFIYGIRDHFGFSTFTYNLAFESFNLMFFLYAIGKRRSGRSPQIYLFLLLCTVFLISIFLNENDFFKAFLSVRYISSAYMFYLALSYTTHTEIQLKLLNKYLVFLFSYQIIASAFKLSLVGYMEGIIGTISLVGAATATIIPLIGIGFAISYYIIYRPDFKFLIFSLGMLFIGMASMKRGVFMYLIPLLAALIFLLQRYGQLSGFMGRIRPGRRILAGVFIIGLIIFGVKYNPHSNPEGIRGGSFDLSYVIKSTIEYTYFNEGEYSFGRFSNFQLVLNEVIKGPAINAIAGHGPATLQGFTRGDGTLESFGIQGPITGLTYQLIQVGGLGAILTLIFILSYSRMAGKVTRAMTDPYWKAFGLGVILSAIIFLLDYFTYSNASISTYSISFIYVYVNAALNKSTSFYKI